MLRQATLIFLGFLLFGAVGCAQAGPRVIVTPRPFHPLAPAVTVVGPARAAWWDWRPVQPAYVVDSVVPAYGAIWSITISDTTGRSATFREGGTTVYEAESFAKQAFRRQFPDHGELSVTSAVVVAP